MYTAVYYLWIQQQVSSGQALIVTIYREFTTPHLPLLPVRQGQGRPSGSICSTTLSSGHSAQVKVAVLPGHHSVAATPRSSC